jgi:hypothetical protein
MTRPHTTTNLDYHCCCVGFIVAINFFKCLGQHLLMLSAHNSPTMLRPLSLLSRLSTSRLFSSNSSSSAPMTGIRSNHIFDQEKLFQYLSANGIDGFHSSANCTVQQFSHGQSNPTFMILGDKGKKYTVRKQPPGHPLFLLLISPFFSRYL